MSKFVTKLLIALTVIFGVLFYGLYFYLAFSELANRNKPREERKSIIIYLDPRCNPDHKPPDVSTWVDHVVPSEHLKGRPKVNVVYWPIIRAVETHDEAMWRVHCNGATPESRVTRIGRWTWDPINNVFTVYAPASAEWDQESMTLTVWDPEDERRLFKNAGEFDYDAPETKPVKYWWFE
jgi:hypothetical protein